MILFSQTIHHQEHQQGDPLHHLDQEVYQHSLESPPQELYEQLHQLLQSLKLDGNTV